ncbi:glycosyltransferase [Desulfonatronum parangueonense]
MTTYVFLPPMAKISGGLAVLMQVAEHLHHCGFPVRIVPRESNRPSLPSWLSTPVLEWNRLKLREEDIWLVPEGWVNALTPGLRASARCVVYVQNWAYLFSSLPEGVSWRDLPVSFLAVSRPVAWFIEQTLGSMYPVLRPGIDRSIFHAPPRKPDGPLRVAYMPRKNKAQVEMIRAIINARNPGLSHPDKLIWEEIHGQDAPGVARILRRAHVFLATGYPEGCPLPPLEAMACGCLPVGFAGFGGWEYMSQIEGEGWRPWWPLPSNPWSGNGFWVPDGDALAAALALEQAVRLWTDTAVAGEREQALRAGQQTAQAFDLDAQRAQVINIWRKS